MSLNELSNNMVKTLVIEILKNYWFFIVALIAIIIVIIVLKSIKK